MPEFSVIIASVNGLPSIAECLTALDKSRRNADAEIVVIDATDEKTREYIQENFPFIKLIKLSERIGIPKMRAIGMDAATGGHLVVIEDHCMVPENWFTEIRRAHQTGYEVVGGAVENGNTESILDWAIFLCEYSSFMPPVPAGEVDFLAGNNVSYSRRAIEQIDESTKKNFWEYFLQTEMRRKNISFFSAPSIVVSHKKDFGFLYFLTQRFHYSRSFAAMRREKSSGFQNVFFVVYPLISPVHLLWRIVKNVWQKRRHRKELILSLPLMTIFMCSYAAGELIGQLFGAGKSLIKVE